MVKKEIVNILQDIVGPIFTGVMFISTYVLEVIEDTESPFIRFAVAVLVLSFAAFYIARTRSVWIQSNKKKKDDEGDNL
jgi:hypothetical protein